MPVKCLLMACDYANKDCELRGCQNDARNLAEAIEKSGAAKRADITMLMEPTLAQIRSAIKGLVDSTKGGDIGNVFISWSGHGMGVPDANGDEIDHQDECLCPSDFAINGVLKDDELGKLISQVHPSTKVSLLFDCCHSGTIIDLPWRYKSLRETELATNSKAVWHPRVVSISGCKDDQTSADAYDAAHHQYAGAMTRAALDVITQEPSLLSDAPAMVMAMRILLRERGMSQIPQLCSSRAANEDLDRRFFDV